jgi:dipeptidase
MITYSADAPFLPRLVHVPAGEHEEGAMIDVWGWEDDDIRGQIRQVRETYGVVGLINDHQVAIGETTTGGRKELRNKDGLLDYDALMLLTLQRARSAREAIEIIDQLCREYGYGSGGESFSIADKDEVWLLELIGKGPGVNGAVWVAGRVPDGCITVHANMSRITEFPLDDPENWLYSPEVISFAKEQGFFDPAVGQPFSFRAAYHPDASKTSLRVCGARVWSVLRRAAPSQDFSADFHRGVEGTKDYPLFVRPDQPLSVGDVMGLMRDHYEGTPFDMTQGIDAGPFRSPYRFRGLTFEVDGQKYCWERPIATQQAGFVMLAQCRNWLPDPIGGVYWFTPDDPYTSCFTPLYCGINDLPEHYEIGDHDQFSWDSAWWVFNMVSNLTYDRWSRVLPDVQRAQKEYEDNYFALLPVVDQTAKGLLEKPEQLQRYLTDFSVGSAERLFQGWRDLATFILTKHNDGYVNDLIKSPRGVGYPDEWLREVIRQRPEQFKLEAKPEN